MITRKNTKKSLLAAMVCLSLSVGTTFAMPQGGNVMVGGNDVVIGDASGKNMEIAVNAPGLIDWDSFSIANGEKVNFAFGGANGLEIINHVTGSTLSEILGTLSSTGNGHVTLINPNGITVGNGAVIDVGGLTLSTLNVDDDLLTKYLHGEEDLVFGDGSISTAMLKVEDGAKINFRSLLELYGGKVQIADGVTIAAVKEGNNAYTQEDEPPMPSTLLIASVNKVTPYRDKPEQKWGFGGWSITSEGAESIGPKEMQANSTNTLEIGGTRSSVGKYDLTPSPFSNNPVSFVKLYGGKVVLKNTGVNAGSGIVVEAFSEKNISKDKDASAPWFEATEDNDVKISNSSLYYGGVGIKGGTIALTDDSSITTANFGPVDIVAVNTISGTGGEDISRTSGNKVVVDNSRISSMWGGVSLSGGAVEIADVNELGSSVNIKAFDTKKTEADGANVVYQASPANVISIKNSIVSAKELEAGSIDITNTVFTTPRLAIVAANEYRTGQENDFVKLSAAATMDNTVRLNNMTQSLNGEELKSTAVVGGKIDVKGKITTANGVILSAGESHDIYFSQDGELDHIDLSSNPSLLTLSDEARDYLKNTEFGYMYTDSAKDNGGNSEGIPRDDANGNSSASGGTSGSGGSSSLIPVNPLPVTPDSRRFDSERAITASSNANNMVQSESDRMTSSSAAELLDASQIILVTTVGQKINQTVHREIDRAVEPQNAEIFMSQADTAGTVLENAATAEPVVVKDNKEKEQE